MSSTLAVLIAGTFVMVQLATLVMRRAVRDHLPYVLMLGGVAAALAFVHETKRHQSPESFLACVLAAVLVFVPRLLESAELRALGRGDALAALAWCRRRELLVPGRAVRQRRRSIESLVELQERGIAAVERRLRGELDALPPGQARVAVALELVSMLMLARRPEQALELVEREVPAEALARRAAIAAQILAVLLVHGRYADATRLLLAMEAGDTATDPRSTALLTEARLLFLAHLGQEAALVKLLDGQLGRLLSEDARRHLLGIAVAAVARGEVIDPVVLQVATGVAARVDEPFGMASVRRPLVTIGLIGLNLLVFVLVSLTLGGDELALVSAGALFRPAVMNGETWRLFTATFLHAGWVHLGMNLLGLWFVGRITEGILGRAAFFVTYLVAAFTGSLASILLNRPSLSVGASGAIFGVVGALLALLVRGAGRLSPAQRRMLVGNLAYLSLLQLLIGLRFELVDNAGHVGGFLGGALAALVLHGRGEPSRFRRFLAQSSVVVLVPGLLIAALQPPRHRLDDTLARLPQRQFEVGNYELSAPSHFVVDPKAAVVYDPYLGIELHPEEPKDGVGPLVLGSPQANEPRVKGLLTRVSRSLHRR